jgi:hypothetical protein
MRNRDQLVFKALCVLDDAIDQSCRGKVPASLGLRFALAYLYAVGDRRREWFDRQPYDEFWRLATKRDEAGNGLHCGTEATARRTSLNAAMNGIARAAGMKITPPIMERLLRARQVIPGAADRK